MIEAFVIKLSFIEKKIFEYGNFSTEYKTASDNIFNIYVYF
jgi:hypothetical protein